VRAGMWLQRRGAKAGHVLAQLRNEMRWFFWVLAKSTLALRPTVSRPVCLGAGPPLGLMTRSAFLLSDSCLVLDVGDLSDERTGP
jgi:hypothetical protein